MKILFSGGSTMGSVMPLLALKNELQKENAKFFWIGTKTGPEKKVIKNAGIEFKSVYAGKLRRYFSLKNLMAPFLSLIGFFQSLFIILKFKPDVILTAGGFVCVPVVWAGWVLRKKIIVHQQDLKVGLANRLMAPLATKITVVFPEMAKSFCEKKVVVTGNPIRKIIFSGTKQAAIQKFNLEPDLPVLLIMGGGTGALIINKMVRQILADLVEFCQIIHITGKGKQFDFKHPRYHQFEFLHQELADAYAAADLVVSRAGFSSLTELAVLGKPTIVIPLPNEDQINNAKYFANKDALIIFEQENLTAEKLLNEIKSSINDFEKLALLSKNISEIMLKDANERYIKFVIGNL